jgi:hypothetical protein
MTQTCATCRWWIERIDKPNNRYLSDQPDGWRLCALTICDGSTDPGPSKAIVCEEDWGLGVLATAPDFGCVQWEHVSSSEQAIHEALQKAHRS